MAAARSAPAGSDEPPSFPIADPADPEQTAAQVALGPTESRIAVLGMPGAGKSTFLNGALYKSIEADNDCEVREFLTSAESDSCTKEVSERNVTYPLPLEPSEPPPLGGVDRVTWIDTMGWPDPDKTQAARMYDEVVENVINNKHGLKCLVWIVDSGRKNQDIYETYKAFMTELKNAKVPIFILVNGRENFANERKRAQGKPAKMQKLQELISNRRADLAKKANELVHVLDMKTPAVFVYVSVEIEEFENDAVNWLLHTARALPTRVSAVRTFERMQLDFATSDKALMSQEADLKAQIKEIKQLDMFGIAFGPKVNPDAVVAAVSAPGLAVQVPWVSGVLMGARVTAAAVTGSCAIAAIMCLGTAGLYYYSTVERNRLVAKAEQELESGEAVVDLKAQAEARKEEIAALAKYLKD